jgi:hypothetical protein
MTPIETTEKSQLGILDQLYIGNQSKLLTDGGILIYNLEICLPFSWHPSLFGPALSSHVPRWMITPIPSYRRGRCIHTFRMIASTATAWSVGICGSIFSDMFNLVEEVSMPLVRLPLLLVVTMSLAQSCNCQFKWPTSLYNSSLWCNISAFVCDGATYCPSTGQYKTSKSPASMALQAMATTDQMW